MTQGATSPQLVRGQAAGDNIVLQWNNAVVEAVPQSGLGGPAMARAFAIINT